MASYSVAANEIGAHAKTLSAATVDTVTFADDVARVEVVSDGSAALYFTTDGSTPTVGGAKAFYMPALAGVREVAVGGAGSTRVKLISSGTPVYSVARVVS